MGSRPTSICSEIPSQKPRAGHGHVESVVKHVTSMLKGVCSVPSTVKYNTGSITDDLEFRTPLGSEAKAHCTKNSHFSLSA